MSDPNLPSGTVLEQEVRFSLVPGEVVSVDRLTDTHFETRSGSVMAFGNVVSVTAPTVTAHTRASKNLWVRQENGTELSIAVHDDVQARAGHEVALLVATGARCRILRHQWCAVVNYTTGRWDRIDQLPPVNTTVEDIVGGNKNFLLIFPATWIAAWLWFSNFSNQHGGDIFFINVFLTIIVFCGSLAVNFARVKSARAAYEKAVARAVGVIFEAGIPQRAPATASTSSG